MSGASAASLADMAALETTWSSDLGVPIVAATSSRELALAEMTAGELGAHHALPASPVRRREWRRGRAALRPVLLRLGVDPDTSRISWPHPKVSLAHDADLAVAVGRCEGVGVGVDIEPVVPLREATARFFLRPAERETLLRGKGLLRAWTAKEAVFKADAGNRGRHLHDYLLDDPAAATGWARRPGGGAWRYATSELATSDGVRVVAVAIAAEEKAPRGG